MKQRHNHIPAAYNVSAQYMSANKPAPNCVEGVAMLTKLQISVTQIT